MASTLPLMLFWAYVVSAWISPAGVYFSEP